MRVAVLALCACNQVYGLNRVDRRDASFFDAPIDAPFGCPSVGGPAPEFSQLLHQVGFQRCSEYSIAAGRATALCNYTRDVYEGPADGQLALVALTQGATGFYGPHLSADASAIYVNLFDYDVNTQVNVTYNRQSDGSWSRGDDAPFSTTITSKFGALAAAADGEHVLVTDSAPSSVTEWLRDASGWHAMWDRPELVDTGDVMVSLTPDGLRVVKQTGEQTLYSDRASTSDAFGAPRTIANIAAVVSPFMTSDCARIYLSGLGATFYVQQR